MKFGWNICVDLSSPQSKVYNSPFCRWRPMMAKAFYTVASWPNTNLSKDKRREHYIDSLPHPTSPFIRQSASFLVFECGKIKIIISSFAAIIMRIGYGIVVQKSDNPYISIAAAWEVFGITGAILVDMFPILKCAPSLFPGAGFQKKAACWKICQHDGRNTFSSRTRTIGTSSFFESSWLMTRSCNAWYVWSLD